MYWVAPLPWANSFISPEVSGDGGELAKDQTKIRRQELGKIPDGNAEDVAAKRQWNKSGWLFTLISAPLVRLTDEVQLPLKFKVEKTPSGPTESKLSASDINYVAVAPPAVLPGTALAHR